MAEALPMRGSAPRRSPIPRRIFLVTAGVLSLLLAGGSAFSIYTIHYAEERLTHIKTGKGCTGDCLPNVDAPEPCSRNPCNFLILGSDSRQGLTKRQQSYYGNTATVQGQRADTIIFVHVDPEHHRTIVLHIPRDLRVNVPGYGENKINSAFEHKNGADLMVRTVEQLTGMQINHYVEVNFVGFRSIVDALGGVKVCIDKPMIDTLAGLHLPKAGCYTLKGSQALAFVRARHVEGDTIPDFSRISRQQQFIRVVIQKLLSFGVVVHFRQVIDAVSNNLIVDDGLNLYDLQDLTRKLSALGQTGVFFRVVPARPVEIDGVSYVEALPQARFLFRQIKENRPPSGIGREQELTNLSPAQIKVRVYDAGASADVQKVVAYLQDAGFVVLPVEPAPAGITTTEIIYRRSSGPEKNVVSSYLPTFRLFLGDRTTNRSGADVVVVVGPDFEGIEG
jgi:LCP family protein required for cell wall assembly